MYKAGCKTTQKFPAIGHPTRVLQSSLQCSTTDSTQSTHFHTLPEQCAEPQHAQHAADVRPEPPPLCDGTSPLHSNTHSNTIVHSFQLVFQSRVRSGRSCRCVINKSQMAPHDSKRNVRMHSTDRRFHTRTATQSRSSTLETTSKQCSLRSNGPGSHFLTAIRRRLTPITVLPQERSRWLQSHTGSETS